MTADSGGSLDANALLRLLLNDMPDQHQAVVQLFESTRSHFMVADTALIELIFVLGRHYQFTRPQIAEAVTGLLSLTELRCNQALFERTLPPFLKHPKLSFEDCYLSVSAELNAAFPLWTFDQKLAHQVASARLIPTKH